MKKIEGRSEREERKDGAKRFTKMISDAVGSLPNADVVVVFYLGLAWNQLVFDGIFRRGDPKETLESQAASMRMNTEAVQGLLRKLGLNDLALVIDGENFWRYDEKKKVSVN